MRSLIAILLTVLFTVTLTFGSSPDLDAAKRPKVYVLSTLHQLHDKTPYYSFDELTRIIDRIDPHIIVVELAPADLASRKEQANKQEYQRSVFPLAEKRGYELVAMEPSEPKFSEIVGLVRSSESALRAASPDKGAAFTVYANYLWEHLLGTWKSPADVNSAETDAMFAVKHGFQNELFGPDQKKGWEAWNQHFLDRITETAQKNPSKRILVLAGAEHGYWLRSRLAAQDGLELVAAAKMFK